MSQHGSATPAAGAGAAGSAGAGGASSPSSNAFGNESQQMQEEEEGAAAGAGGGAGGGSIITGTPLPASSGASLASSPADTAVPAAPIPASTGAGAADAAAAAGAESDSAADTAAGVASTDLLPYLLTPAAAAGQEWRQAGLVPLHSHISWKLSSARQGNGIRELLDSKVRRATVAPFFLHFFYSFFAIHYLWPLPPSLPCLPPSFLLPPAV